MASSRLTSTAGYLAAISAFYSKLSLFVLLLLFLDDGLLWLVVFEVLCRYSFLSWSSAAVPVFRFRGVLDSAVCLCLVGRMVATCAAFIG